MKSIFIFLISFLIVSFINISNAQERFEQRPIEEALNPDGTLKEGVQGSFKVEGYEMHTGASGKPIFVPKTENTENSTWEAIGTGGGNGVNNDVLTLAVEGNNLYIGGRFTRANQGGTLVNANSIVRFNTTTNTWETLGTGTQNGVNNYVHALAIDVQGKVYVGGRFTQAGGVNANRIARFDPATNTWNALGAGVGNDVNNAVYALTIIGDDLYIGGSFTQAGGISANNIVRFNTATNTWSSLTGTGGSNGTNNDVYALASVGNDLYIGGSFTQAGGINANRIVRFNITTNTWNILGTGGGNGVSGSVHAIVVRENDLFIGGGFSQANVGGTLVYPANIVRYNILTNTWNLLLGSLAANGVNSTVYSLALAGDDLYIAGAFSYASGGSLEANRIVRYNITTGTWHKLGSGNNHGTSNQVNALAVMGSNLYVGGWFTRVNVISYLITSGIPANYVARWTNITTNVEQIGDGVPSNYSLSQNYPNPFNPSTTISFSIPNSEFVTLKVYDVLGREVATLVNENLNAGSYSYNFDASNLTSGVYLYKLQTGKYSETKKMILSK